MDEHGGRGKQIDEKFCLTGKETSHVFLKYISRDSRDWMKLRPSRCAQILSCVYYVISEETIPLKYKHRTPSSD